MSKQKQKQQVSESESSESESDDEGFDLFSEKKSNFGYKLIFLFIIMLILSVFLESLKLFRRLI